MFAIGQHVKSTVGSPGIRGKVVDYATTGEGKQIVLIAAHDSSKRREWWEAERVELVPDPSFSHVSDALYDAMVSHFDDGNDFIEGFPLYVSLSPEDIDTGHRTRMRVKFGNREVEINITEVRK